jgi:hypothetical protein
VGKLQEVKLQKICSLVGGNRNGEETYLQSYAAEGINITRCGRNGRLFMKELIG